MQDSRIWWKLGAPVTLWSLNIPLNIDTVSWAQHVSRWLCSSLCILLCNHAVETLEAYYEISFREHLLSTMFVFCTLILCHHCIPNCGTKQFPKLELDLMSTNNFCNHNLKVSLAKFLTCNIGTVGWLSIWKKSPVLFFKHWKSMPFCD